MHIAVVGAGPAGLAFATRIKDVDIFEEHPQVGLPRHCTSLVSGRAAEGVVPNGIVLNKYRELVVTDLERREIRFRVRGGIYLLDRPGLELWLASQLPSIGLNRRVDRVEGRYLYTTEGERLGPYDYIVVAEGAARRLSKAFGHVVRLPGLQVDIKSDVDIEGITVVYNQKLSKAYFSWIVEIDRGVYRVGLADLGNVVEKLGKLVKIMKGKPLGKPFGGGVLAGPPLRGLVHGRVVLVGDAAGFVKPLSGGGIVLALRSGWAAAEALERGEPRRYEWGTLPTRARLRLSFAAFRVLYGQRLVDRLLQVLDGGEYVAVDYDDHLKSLAIAALTDLRSLVAVRDFLRYLAGNSDVFHLF
ncbi:MAG: NAD(P)/FAD-dependent oxidoreductase [Pyrobaculum sp.]